MEGIRIRSRCQWYEEGEKSSKFFLNLEKFNVVQSQIRKIIVSDQEITDRNIILNEIRIFYESIFKKGVSKRPSQIHDFLDKVQLPKLNITEINKCDDELSEEDLYISLMSMQNNKSHGNDGLTKEFFVTFWEDIKDAFLNSCRTAKLKKEVSTSQRQAVIKLIEKKYKDKRFIKNWRPISLLNVDHKIISKALASRFKKVLTNLISPQQTAYVENRFIGESGRLIADIEITDILNKEGFLVAMDIEKAFDSLDHTFLISVLKKFGFGNNFVNWIETLISKQESCVINGGDTTQYFHLEREARQGDPISAYLFILALEVLSFLVRNNKDIKGLNIFDHLFIINSLCR